MKIAIIEVSESHEECIYTQVKFLIDEGHSVHLILNSVLKNQIKAYEDLCDSVSFIDFIEKGFFAKLRQQFSLLKQLRTYDKIVFNTASSSKTVRNLTFFLNFYSIECIGLLHNTKRLQSSFTQKVISLKIKKYFVLNDYLLDSDFKKKEISLESFYPIYFPYKMQPVKAKKDAIWIGIPGRIDYDRRSYTGLMATLSGLKKPKQIKFLILGKLNHDTPHGTQLMESIKNYGLEDYFVLFDRFIANEEYHTYLKECDYIMPLLKKDSGYLNHKISGSFNLAFAYKKPLICNTYFESIPDLKENSYFYDTDTLGQLLVNLDEGKAKPKNRYSNTKWNYDDIKKRYLDFIFS